MMASFSAPFSSDGRTEDSMMSSRARRASSVGWILSSSEWMTSRILSRIRAQLWRGSALESGVMESSIMRGTLLDKVSLALLAEQRAVLRDNDRLVADEVYNELKGAGTLRGPSPLGIRGLEVEHRMHRADFARRVARGADG